MHAAPVRPPVARPRKYWTGELKRRYDLISSPTFRTRDSLPTQKPGCHDCHDVPWLIVAIVAEYPPPDQPVSRTHPLRTITRARDFFFSTTTSENTVVIVASWQVQDSKAIILPRSDGPSWSMETVGYGSNTAPSTQMAGPQRRHGHSPARLPRQHFGVCGEEKCLARVIA